MTAMVNGHEALMGEGHRRHDSRYDFMRTPFGICAEPHMPNLCGHALADVYR